MKTIYIGITLMLLAGVTLFSCKKEKHTEIKNDSQVSPVAAFSLTGDRRVNSEIQFENNSLYADTYKWTFGNGETSTKPTPDKIKYNNEGVYEVVLTAIKGERRAVYKQVVAIAPDNKPYAHFTFTYKDDKTSAPAKVQFKNESVNALNYKWVIDGNNYYDTNPLITFTTAGDHLVSLTAINGQEQVSYADVVNITVNNDPMAGFVLPYHPYPYKVNEEIQLVNTSKNADSWVWTFGTDGPAASTEQHPVIKFTKAGNHAIKLVAKKGALQSAPKTITLLINP